MNANNSQCFGLYYVNISFSVLSLISRLIRSQKYEKKLNGRLFIKKCLFLQSDYNINAL